MIVKGLQIVLILFFAVYAFLFITTTIKSKNNGELEEENPIKPIVTGFSTDFLDTLGIGSFAPTMFLFKALRHNIPNKDIPGTLNVAHTLPVLLEAIIFISAVKVEPVTLICLLVSAAIGAYIGAGIISKLNGRIIQLVMGIALLAAAVFFTMSVLNLFPVGGTALGLKGVKLIVAIVIFFILGALMTAGIGLYAPAMVVVYSMGMNPAAAFPIMMGACAVLMPVASIKFMKEGAYAKKNSIFIAIAGLVGVVVAYKFFSGLSVEKLKILVIVVVTVTGIMMLKSAMKKISDAPDNSITED